MTCHGNFHAPWECAAAVDATDAASRAADSEVISMRWRALGFLTDFMVDLQVFLRVRD
jgi:hypothetical protein